MTERIKFQRNVHGVVDITDEAKLAAVAVGLRDRYGMGARVAFEFRDAVSRFLVQKVREAQLDNIAQPHEKLVAAVMARYPHHAYIDRLEILPPGAENLDVEVA